MPEAEVDSNISSGEPAAANLQVDLPVTAGAVLGASAVQKPVQHLTKKVGPLKKYQKPPFDYKLGQPNHHTLPGVSAGGLLEGTAAGGGEYLGAKVGDILEQGGTPTNIQLTNDEGKLDLGFDFSNRNKE